MIGLAETNIDPAQQGLYQIPAYTGFYRETLAGKKKAQVLHSMYLTI